MGLAWSSLEPSWSHLGLIHNGNGVILGHVEQAIVHGNLSHPNVQSQINVGVARKGFQVHQFVKFHNALVLESPLLHFSPFWGHLEPSRGHLDRSWGHLGRNSGHVGAVLGLSQALLRPS